MPRRLSNLLVYAILLVLSLVLIWYFRMYGAAFPALIVRFMLGWGLGLLIGVASFFLFRGSVPVKLLLGVLVPAGWYAWFTLGPGVAANAQADLLRYLAFSTGFIVAGYLLAALYSHLARMSQR